MLITNEHGLDNYCRMRGWVWGYDFNSIYAQALDILQMYPSPGEDESYEDVIRGCLIEPEDVDYSDEYGWEVLPVLFLSIDMLMSEFSNNIEGLTILEESDIFDYTDIF